MNGKTMGNGNYTPLQSLGITIIRVAVGVVFLMHGGQKLFVGGFEGVAAFLSRLDVPAPCWQES